MRSLVDALLARHRKYSVPLPAPYWDSADTSLQGVWEAVIVGDVFAALDGTYRLVIGCWV